MQSRINKLRKEFDSLNIDGMLISSPYNRRYLSGFTGTNGYIIIGKESNTFVTDFRYDEQSKKQCLGFEVVIYAKDINETLLSILNKQEIKNLGFEDSHVTCKQYNKLKQTFNEIELIPTGDLIEKLRRNKDNQEIDKIRKAACITDEAFSHILNVIKPGLTELEIALELEFFMRKKGASSISFETIVASGERSSMPHGVASDKVMKNGDVLTLDFGCIYEGYCSDMTRTIFVGNADKKMKKIYDIVLDAQVSALSAVKPGAICSDIDAIARGIIRDNGYVKNFGHGLGHSVGLEIHEAPRFSPTDKSALETGMVITVEPGIYVEGLGGVRIEDLIVITENGYENLTNSPKDIIVI